MGLNKIRTVCCFFPWYTAWDRLIRAAAYPGELRFDVHQHSRSLSFERKPIFRVLRLVIVPQAFSEALDDAFHAAKSFLSDNETVNGAGSEKKPDKVIDERSLISCVISGKLL